MKSIESHGKTIEAAVEAGLTELNTTREKVKIEIISQGGLFRKASVRLTVEDTEGERAFRFVEGLLDKLGVQAAATLTEDDECAKIDVTGVDVGAIIGHRGEVLDAVQYLASLIANKNEEEKFKRVVVDGEGYREKRIAALEELADRLAEKAVSINRSVSAEPMNPYERRVIHARLQQNEAVTTHSEGEEPNRYLVVTPKGVTPGGHKTYFPRGGNYGRDGGFGGGRNFGNRDGGRGGNYGGGRNGGGNRPGGGDRPGGDRRGGFGGGAGGSGNYGNRSGGGDRQNNNYGNRDNYGGSRDRNGGGDGRGGRNYDNEGFPPEKYGDTESGGYAGGSAPQSKPSASGGSRQQFAFRSSNRKPSPYSRLSGFSDAGKGKSGFSDDASLRPSGFADAAPPKSGFSDDALMGGGKSKFTKE